MRKLSKNQLTQLDNCLNMLRKGEASISNAYSALEAAHSELALAVENYNKVVDEAESFRDEIISMMQEYFDERSEGWQDGDAGTSYQDWIDEWEAMDFTRLDVPDLPDAPDCVHADDMENLPQEVQ